MDKLIATIAAGARQQSRFIAMMDNYDRTMELVNVAYDSNGKAAEQFGKYSDTLEYKLNKLTNTWEQMRLKFLSSNFLKDAVDMLNNLLKKIQNFDAGDFLKLGAVWLTLGKSAIQNFIKGAQASAASVQKIFSNIFSKIPKISFKTSDAKMQLNSLKNQINTLGDTVTTLDGKEITIKAKYEGLSAEELKNKLNSGDISDDERNYINARISEEEKSAIIKEQESIWSSAASAASQAFSASFTAGITALTLDESPGKTFATSFLSGATTSLTSGMSAFNSAISSGLSALQGFKSGLISGAVSLGVSALTAGVTALISWRKEVEATEQKERMLSDSISSHTLAIKHLTEKQEELNDKYTEEQTELDKLQSEYDQINEKFELYNELNNVPLKTNEEREELLTVTEDLVNLMPEVVDYYDQEGNAVIQNTEKIRELINVKKQLYAQQKQETLKAQAEKDTNEYEIAYHEAERLKSAQEKYKKYYDYIEKIKTAKPKQGSKNFMSDTIGRSAAIQGDATLSYILTGDFYEKEGMIDEYSIEAILGSLAHGGKTDTKSSELISLIITAIQSQDEALYNQLTNNGELTDMSQIGINLRDYIDDIGDDEEEKAAWANIVEYIKQFYDNIDADIKKANDDLEAKKEQVEQNYKDTLRNSADLNEDFLNLNKNAQELVISGAQQSVFGDQNITDKINEELYANHTDWFDKNDDGTITIKHDLNIQEQDAYNNAFTEKMNDYIDDSEQYIKDFMKNLDDGEIAKIDAIYKAAEENQWTWKEIVEEFKKVFGNTNPEIMDAIIVQNQKNIDDYNAKLKETATYFGEQNKTSKGLDKDTGIMQYDEGTFTNWYQGLEQSTSSAVSAGMDAATRNIDPASVNDMAKAYGYAIQNALESGLIEADIFSAFTSSGIFNENFSFLDLEETKEKFVKDVEEMGHSTEEAMANWDALYNYAQDYGMIDFGITTEDTLNETAKEIENNLNNIVKSYDNASSAITAQLENGGLNLTEYLELSETLSEVGLNIQDYITGMQNGLYQLNTDAMTQAYHDAVEAESLTVDELKAQLEQRRTNLQAMLGQVDAEGNYYIAASNSTNALWDQYDAAYALYEVTKARVKMEGGTVEEIGKATFKPRDKITTTINRADIEAEIAWIDDLIGDDKKLQAYTDMTNANSAAHTQIAQKEANAIDKATKATKGGSSAAKDAADAADKLREAQEKLNEALYGTENYKNAADHLANYTERLEELTDKANKAKESLEDLGETDSAKDLLSDYAENVKLENITRTAENQVLQQSMDDLLNILNDKYSEYFQKVGDTWMWNASVVDAQMNDNEKDFLIESIENLNEYQDKIDENLDAIEEREKEFKEMRKTALDSRIALEEEVVNILEEKYQKEIDATQEKYDALKEADDDYLDALEDAINKQRELRDRANEYEDLAQKERKLALKQRDTSGANKKDTLQLQQEVEESRQDMLDNEVDRLLESMKEMYELQQESREAELEYMNAMIENGQLLQEANEIIASFSTREDMLAWFFENNQELADMSVAATEKYKMELEDMYDAAELYYIMSETNLEELTSFTQEEVADTVATIGETLTLEAERSYNEMRETVDKEVEDAKQAVIDAQKAVEDAAASSASAVGGAAGSMTNAAETTSTTSQQTIKTIEDVCTSAINAVIAAANNANNAKVASGNITNFENDVVKGGASVGSYVTGVKAKMKAAELNPVAKQQSISEQLKQAVLQGPTNGQTIYRSVNNKNNSKYENQSNIKYKMVIGNDTYYFTSRNEFLKYKVNAPKGSTYAGSIRNGKREWDQFKTGGLVDYTGPAWVDGTPSKPEAFLNSDDTKRIGEAAKLLSNLPILNSTSSASTQLSTNIGDTSIEIHINVDSISSDYDVDRLAERIKSDIVDASKPVGTPVILKR